MEGMVRTFWKSNKFPAKARGYSDKKDEILTEVEEADATLVGSRVKDFNLHMPTIDIDFPCTLTPSDTHGHFHLKIDVAMNWDMYLRLLDVMVECGIVQAGFVQMTRERGLSTLATKPWKDIPF